MVVCRKFEISLYVIYAENPRASSRKLMFAMESPLFNS